jgi:replicative DNA helicase
MIKEYSPDHENALIGAIFLNPNVYDELEVNIGWFRQPKQKRIAQAMQDIINSGMQPDIINVHDKIKYEVDAAFISQMTSCVPTSANAGYYADILKRNHEFCQLEQLRLHMGEWLKTEDASSMLYEIDKYITSISESDNSKVVHFGAKIHEAINQILAAHARKGELDGLSTGYHSLDNYLCGMAPGDFIIIGARPGHGKSTLMMNIATNIASNRIPVGIFELEMSGVNLAKREMAGGLRVDYKQIRTGNLSNPELTRLVTVAGDLNACQIYIDDTPGIQIAKLWQRARQMKRKGVQIIFIDYITLIRHPNNKLKQWEAVSEIGNSIKQIARELSIPIVALSQLRREGADKPPRMEDIRASGSLEQDADTIIFIYCKEDEDNTDIIFAKNRNGPLGTVQMVFRREYLKFCEIYKT